MRDSWSPTDDTWDEVVESMGQPIVCSRCYRRGEMSVVGFLSDVNGRPALTPAERFTPDDRDWSRAEMPALVSPETRLPVNLTCQRCHRACGQWKAETVLARVARGKPWVPAT